MPTFDDFPIVLNFDVVQHSDWTKTLTYNVNGTPFNLTGYGAEMTVWNDSGVKLITLTQSSGIALGGSAGTITLTIDDATLTAIAYGAHNFDLWLIDGSGNRRIFAVGKFNVRRAVRS